MARSVPRARVADPKRPEDLHRQLKARAALEGKSLSEFAVGEFRHALQRPSTAEIAERIRALGAANVGETGAQAVRAERDAG